MSGTETPQEMEQKQRKGNLNNNIEHGARAIATG